MNRRRFLSLLGQATVGATVAYSFPSIIVPKNIQHVAPDYAMAPRGLAWLINAGHTFSGYDPVSFPDLNSPVVELAGLKLTPESFDAARRMLSSMTWKTSDPRLVNPLLV